MSTINNTTTTTTASVPLPSSPPNSDSNMSLITVVLALIVLLAIPTVIYAFFFAIKCPPNPFRRLNRSSVSRSMWSTTNSSHVNKTDWASEMKYMKETHGKDHGGACPVCLSVFLEGEEIKMLNACKHLFHVACIDKWLYSHSNCPVCRATVTKKGSKQVVVVVNVDGDPAWLAGFG